MITREQVVDLREGDVVEYHRNDWPEGVVIRGALHQSLTGGAWIGLGDHPVRFDNGDINGYSMNEETTLTVISRVPRLYVNHDRGAAEVGDIATPADAAHVGEVYVRWGNGWAVPGVTDALDHEDIPSPLRLLVDGETGQVVP